MKTTITGARGFVGSNLAAYLKTSHEVFSMSVRYKTHQELKLNGDAIVHLAGKAHDLKKVSQPQEYYEANFELTKQLFDAFLVSEARVFIFMSTVKAVADRVEGMLTEEGVLNSKRITAKTQRREDLSTAFEVTGGGNSKTEIPNSNVKNPNSKVEPTEPKTHYGIAKQMAEQYILSQELPEGKRVYILRPCMIHGPGNKGNLNLLYQLVAKGLPWPLGAFENQRSFLSIENLCFVIKELLENEAIPSGVYNVADDEALSTNELIELLGETLAKPVKIWNLSKNVIRSLARIGDVLPLPLNSERLQKLTESYVVDNSKLKLALGKDLPIQTREGLMTTFQSFLTK
ncbi:NAD-dependent epimerase/dehydratase family protein [Flavobacterium sp. RSSA_27]|uniref:NAD-dependent epimerase/dehydratase family protein n=1 Tax=Flavobacterium sp. RSSA_27 TaxID=3447667 RepID=UPI003F32A3C7